MRSVWIIIGIKSQEIQKQWFRRQMELAGRPDLPVMIHSRNAAEDTMNIDESTRSGSTGCHPLLFLFKRDGTGIIQDGLLYWRRWRCDIQKREKTKRSCRRNSIKRILLETDCPYMAPEPHRGMRNNSAYIRYVAKILSVKGTDLRRSSRADRKECKKDVPVVA